MAGRRLIWLPSAQKERADILRYWRQRNQSASFSTKLNEQIRVRLQELKTQPFTGKKCADLESVYFVTVHEYLVFYRVAEDIIILAVWDRRRNPASAPYPTELNEP